MKNKRILAIGDIHGMYNKLVKLLEIIKYNPKNDELFLLGDYIDRGPDSKKVVDLVIELVNNGAKAICGNHEDMLLKSFNSYEWYQTWLYNGGHKTIKSYEGNIFAVDYKKELKDKIPREHIEFFKNLPIGYEIEDYIFIHAGLPEYANHPDEAKEYDLMWVRDEWIQRPYNRKTIVFGHTPTFLIKGHEKPEPWFGQNKICIDTGAVFEKRGGKLTCLELPCCKTWQV